MTSQLPKLPNGLPAVYHDAPRWAWNNWKRQWVLTYGYKPREVLPPIQGCELPPTMSGWYKIKTAQHMARFLDTLPSNVEPLEIVAQFAAWGCPVERFAFDADYLAVALAVSGAGELVYCPDCDGFYDANIQRVICDGGQHARLDGKD